MSCIKRYCFIIFCFILLPSNLTGQIIILTGGGDAAQTSADPISADIEMDYFFGERTLRSKYMVCKGIELKQECRMMCGDNYACIFDDCICLDRDLKKNKKRKGENLPPSKEEIRILLHEFEDPIVPGAPRRFSSDKQKEVKLLKRPALRHHIAHFCPNLAIARQCIRKCMKLGKPAFCGKDHNCYCGHRYDQHSVDGKIDVDDTYAKFRDLYTKYFGTEGSNPVEIYGK